MLAQPSWRRETYAANGYSKILCKPDPVCPRLHVRIRVVCRFVSLVVICLKHYETRREAYQLRLIGQLSDSHLPLSDIAHAGQGQLNHLH